MDDGNPKMVVLGFDGASWNVVRPMLEDELLPNLRRIMDSGVYARLRTPWPPSTPIIWTTLYTGAHAQNHGIKNFFNTLHDLKTPRIWDIILHGGGTAGLCGNYFTSPIDTRLAFCIPSHFDSGVETKPERYSFIRKLTRSFEAKSISIDRLLASGFSAIRNGLRSRSITFAVRSVLAAALNRQYFNWYHRFQRVFMDLSFDVFLHAYSEFRPDFASCYTPLPDTVSHKYWSFHEPERFDNVDPKQVKKFGKVIRDTYRHCDRRVGSVLKAVSQNTLICVLSDHGFQALENPHDRVVIVPEKLIRFLNLQDKVVATNLGHQVIVQPREEEKGMTAKLLKTLKEAYIADIKRPAFLNFHVDEQTDTIRFRVNWHKITDLHRRVVLDGKKISMSHIAKVGSTWTGEHDAEDGIFMLCGPGVPDGGEKETIDAVDIAPTLLRLQALDVSNCTDGKMRMDMIDREWAEKNPARAIESYDDIMFKPSRAAEIDREDIAKKLQSLGYM